MTSPKVDVLGIGNAIVDILASADDALLKAQGMAKGSMALIDEPRAAAIYKAMGPGTEISGGSAANTMVGLASLGSRAAFVGKVRNDDLGKIFVHDIRAANVAFETKPAEGGPATACCYILVTPDGERTMNTFLGAAQNLAPGDIDADQIASAAVTYLEGYLWDPKDAKDAFVKAATLAHDAKRMVALTLSDAFCVGRYRSEFLDLLRKRTVDLVFANEAELTSLYETNDFDAALKQIRNDAALAVVTRSEKGCVVASKDNVVSVPAHPIVKLVDTTGAGDLFAAGFLTGLTRNLDHATCGRLGALAAAEIIQHLGARPQVSLADLARREKLLP
jgi:sugar/nucleoside kinase (ribokinase family)